MVTPFVSGALYDASEGLGCEPCVKLCPVKGLDNLDFAPANQPDYATMADELLGPKYKDAQGTGPSP